MSSNDEMNKVESVDQSMQKKISSSKKQNNSSPFQTTLPMKEEIKNQNKYSYDDCRISNGDRARLLKAFKPTNKDLNLKILGKILYAAKGYHCELECKLFDETYYEKYRKEQISDLDIWGIKFEDDLNILKVGIECKSTTSNGIDEVLKIKGIQILNSLDYVGLFKKSISNNVRMVAGKINVQVNDEKEISRIVNILVSNSKELIDDELNIYCLSNGIEQELKLSIKGAVGFLKGLYWTNKSHENVHTIVRLLEHISSRRLLGYQYKYFTLKLSILLAVAFLEISSQIVKNDLSNLEFAALDQLFGGASQRWELSRTYDLLSQEIGKKLSPYPYYTKEYINIINWLTQDMCNSSKVVLCLNHYLNTYLLGKELVPQMEGFNGATLKLSKDILRFVSRIIKADDVFVDIYEI